MGLRGSLLCVCGVSSVGLRGLPAPCVGNARGGGGVPPCWRARTGCGAEGDRPAWGRPGQGSWEEEGPPGKELKTWVVVSCWGSKCPALSCSQKAPVLSAHRLPSCRDRERRGEGNRQGRAIHLESSLLGEGERWGKRLTLWCQSKRGVCLWLIVLRLEIEMFPA